MRNLLKADFKRIFKDKLLIVMGILAVVFATTTPLLYAALFSGMELMDNPLIAGSITGKTLFFASFSMGNNLGLIVPVLLAIALRKDFSFGTIRNKIIAGKSRSQIFLSLWITCSAVLIGVMLLHAFLTLGTGLLFFDYQTTPFTAADFWYFLASLGFEILVLLFISALISCLCAGMKNVGLVIVLYIAIAFILVLAGSALQMVLGFLEMSGGNENTLSLLRFLDRINVGSATAYIGTGTAYTVEDVLYLILPAAVGTLGLTGFGLWTFNKKDLK